TPGLYADVVRTIAAANYSQRYKVWLWWQYSRTLVYKYAGFSMLGYLSTERELRPFMRERIAAAPAGFYAKDAELAASSFADNVATMQRVRDSFVRNQHRLDDRRRLHVSKYDRDWTLSSSPYVTRLNRLIRDARDRNIDLIFYLPPLLTPAGVEFAYPVFLQLPESQRIDLSDPRTYPQLYSPEYLFDLEHVNSDGAALLSRYLAAETVRLR
ncbi:MAG: hypothetical protein KJP03_00715, partial [Gammaproteobacteria bacterium]|nr:hypothetical protein [Gammaproteobacteria bacterium]